MITVVIGGSGSGKSDYAESLLQNYSGRKLYLATMQVYDDDGRAKVERHRRRRAGKGFDTVELPRDIIKLKDELVKGKCAVLLECMSNLVANEMFSQEGCNNPDEVREKIIKEVSEISKNIEEFVIVTNNVSEDGVVYDEETMAYIKALSDVNVGLTAIADKVTEVVVGIPVSIKEGE